MPSQETSIRWAEAYGYWYPHIAAGIALFLVVLLAVALVKSEVSKWDH